MNTGTEHYLRGNSADTAKEKTELLAALASGEVLFPLEIMGMGVDFTTQELVVEGLREGVIASLTAVGSGYNDIRDQLGSIPNFKDRVALSHRANAEALLKKIAYVRERQPNRIFGVNLMRAVSDYENLLQVIGKSEQVDLLFVGAGIARDLPEKMTAYPWMHYVPIISSARVAAMFVAQAKKNDNRSPLAFYVELPTKAGGHLGAKDAEDALDAEKFDPQKLLEEIQKAAPGIPLILGGGITHSQHIEAAHAMGYSGAGIGTRALLTQESGLSNNLIINHYLNPDAKIVTGMTSPAGLPSRFVENPAFDNTIAHQIRRAIVARCVSCIGAERCQFLAGNTPYCIAESLSATRRGEPDGLLFTGSELGVLRNDDLYKGENGELRVPTLAEALAFTLDPRNVPQTDSSKG